MVHDATDSVSRRTVLKTTGGLLAGATVFAGQTAATPNFDDFIAEVERMDEEVIVIRVRMSEEVYERVNERGIERAVLGLAERFVVREETVSLPEDTSGLAALVEIDFENSHDVSLVFRTGDVDLEGGGEEVTLGIGLFTERTFLRYQWATCPGHRDY